MRENEAGGQAAGVDVAVGDAISRAAEEMKRRIATEGAVVGGGSGRGRRIVWAILSILFVLGFAASTAIASAERDAALEDVVGRARDEALFVATTLDGARLSEPVKGSSYDRAAAKIWRSVSSHDSIVGVTVWSSEARIVFSLDGSVVGTKQPQMRPLIDRMSQASNPSRIVDDSVQTFMPITNASGRRVAVVQVDQPLAVVDAEIGAIWSTLRLGSGLGLAVSLLLLGLTFFSKRPARAPQDDAERPDSKTSAPTPQDDAEPPERTEPLEADGRAEISEEPPGDEAPTDEPAPWWEEQLRVLGSDLARAMDQQSAPEADLAPAMDQQSAPEADLGDAVDRQTALDGDLSVAVDQHAPRDGDVDAQELMRQRREAFKARAEQARLRGKKVAGELQEAASGTESGE